MIMAKGDHPMKELVAANGGYFVCALRTKDGRSYDRVLARARTAKAARAKLARVLGCAITAFAVKAVCP